jgi:hypothetical protein
MTSTNNRFGEGISRTPFSRRLAETIWYRRRTGCHGNRGERSRSFDFCGAIASDALIGFDEDEKTAAEAAVSSGTYIT